MTDRRVFMHAALVLGGGAALRAADPWVKKAASEWSQEEIQRLKTASPWAHKVKIEMANTGPGSMDRQGSAGTFGGMTGADQNGIRGGGGGRGSRTMDTSSAAPQTPEIIVRWESAKPMLEGTQLVLPSTFEKSYAISVTGLPPAILRRMAAVESGSDDPAARQRAMVERLLAGTTLSAHGRDPQTAGFLIQSPDRQSIIFAFAKETLPLTANDKDVIFAMQFGSTAIRAKFQPKEMMFHGELAL